MRTPARPKALAARFCIAALGINPSATRPNPSMAALPIASGPASQSPVFFSDRAQLLVSRGLFPVQSGHVRAVSGSLAPSERRYHSGIAEPAMRYPATPDAAPAASAPPTRPDPGIGIAACSRGGACQSCRNSRRHGPERKPKARDSGSNRLTRRITLPLTLQFGGSLVGLLLRLSAFLHEARCPPRVAVRPLQSGIGLRQCALDAGDELLGRAFVERAQRITQIKGWLVGFWWLRRRGQRGRLRRETAWPVAVRLQALSELSRVGIIRPSLSKAGTDGG